MIRKVLFNLGEVREFFKDFNTEEFAFDTETSHGEESEKMMLDKDYQPLPSTKPLMYGYQVITAIQFCDGESACHIVLHNGNRDEIISWLSEHLFNSSNRGKGKKIVCQNIPFDASVVHKYGIDFSLAKWFDTKVASHLVDENTPNGLKYMVENILGKEVAHFNPRINHYTQEFFNYGLDDAENTWLLYQHFLPLMLSDQQTARLFFKIEMPFQRVLTEMRVNGVDVNIKLLAEQKEILVKDKLQLLKKLHEAVNAPYTIQKSLCGEDAIVSNTNFNSAVQLSKILFEQLGLEQLETTPTGQPKVGKATKSKYKDNPFVKLLIEYTGCEKLLSSFVEPLPNHIDVDGKVRPDFNDTGTKTGRLSCSNPNLQQLADPKKADYKKINFREVFKAPSGYKMFSADYSGQEIAVMAQVSKDPTLIKSLNSGFDMHLAIANQFYDLGIPEECLSKEHSDYDMYKDKFKVERGRAKTITFGLAYGKGAYGFSKDFGITEEEAQKIVDDYFSGMPQLKAAIDNTHKEVKSSGYVRNLAGRYRHFQANEQGFYPNSALRQSFNFKIQGFAADMIRIAGVNIWIGKQKNPEWDLKFIMTVHDEIVFLVKEEYVDEATAFVKKKMEEAVNFVVPVTSDIEIGENYGSAK